MAEDYLARITEDKRTQTLEAHSGEVARLAAEFGKAFGAETLLRIAGAYHDFGKAQPEFQRYIKGLEGKRGDVKHSAFGAKKILKDIGLPIVAEMLANCITAHHSGLYDDLTTDGDTPLRDLLDGDEARDLPFQTPAPDTAALKAEFDRIVSRFPEKERAFGLSMLTRLIYSCLVDADRWDAYLFESQKTGEQGRADWGSFLEKLEQGLEKLEQGLEELASESETEMSRLRGRVSLACAEAGHWAQGIYKLETPTGGGKTYSSLRFALEHAKAHKLDRIIYVIPYLSITSQTAQDIRDILGADSDTILEHHSNFLPEEKSEDAKTYRLHTDRWDAPIILTTQVQFLESVFSAKAGDLRKLHNMTRSVIIFDEAQSLPLKCVYLFNGAINFLHRVCGSTILLCTATQPLLDKVAYPILFSPKPSIADCGEAPKRYEIKDKLKTGGYSYPELASFVMDKHKTSTLAIVNTKAAAKNLYTELVNIGAPVLHLSTDMCAAHRDTVIGEVKRRLEVKESVVCVSTQLIEAGVNISFECVVRDIAGLDSIYQAAGRCNRHGELGEIKDVYIVDIAGEKLDKLPDIKAGAEITRRLLHEKNLDINLFYQLYFHAREKEMAYLLKDDVNTLYDMLAGNRRGWKAYSRRADKRGEKPLALPSAIRSAAEEFFVIDRGRTDIVVPYGEAEELLGRYSATEKFSEKRILLRKLGRYSVSIYQYQLDELKKSGALYEHEGIVCLEKGFYDDKFGVKMQGQHEFLYA